MSCEFLGDAFDKAHLWHPYASALTPPPVYKVARASGCEIELADGQRVIDGISSWWCMIHGYQHPKIMAALHEQLGTLSHVMFAGLTHDKAIELGKKLLALLPSELKTIFYADSGSVAVEAAMKMALQYQSALGKTEKSNFATFKGGYHGDTFNAMSVCDPVEGMHSIFGPSLPVRLFLERPQVPFGGDFALDSAEVQAICGFFEKHADELAGFIVEPIVQGAGGMYFYHLEYLKLIRQLCTEHEVVLIFDEIATGFYRTGPAFALEHADAVPDIITLGKALTGGALTLSAVVTREEISSAISRANPHAFMHGPTFMANPLACAAACASLDLMAENSYQKRALELEGQLKKLLSPLASHPSVRQVRVLGAIGAVELVGSANVPYWQQELTRRGVWLRPMGRVVYLMPPFVITEEQLWRISKALSEVLDHKSAILPAN